MASMPCSEGHTEKHTMQSGAQGAAHKRGPCRSQPRRRPAVAEPSLSSGSNPRSAAARPPSHRAARCTATEALVLTNAIVVDTVAAIVVVVAAVAVALAVAAAVVVALSVARKR